METAPASASKRANTSSFPLTNLLRLYRRPNSSMERYWVNLNTFPGEWLNEPAILPSEEEASIFNPFPDSGSQNVTPLVWTPYVSFRFLKYLHHTTPPVLSIPP